MDHMPCAINIVLVVYFWTKEITSTN